MNATKAIVRRGIPIRSLTYVLLLAFSLIVLGSVGAGFSISLANSLDMLRRKDLPASSIMRIVARESGRMRRSLDSLAVTDATVNHEQEKQQVAEFRALNDDNLRQIRALLTGEEVTILMAELLAARRVYLEAVDTFLTVGSNPAEGATVFSQTKHAVAVAYESYRDKQDQLAEYCEKQADERSANIVDNVRRFERFSLLLALWPIVAGIGLFLYGIVSTALLFFRERS